MANGLIHLKGNVSRAAGGNTESTHIAHHKPVLAVVAQVHQLAATGLVGLENRRGRAAAGGKAFGKGHTGAVHRKQGRAIDFQFHEVTGLARRLVDLDGHVAGGIGGNAERAGAANNHPGLGVVFQRQQVAPAILAQNKGRLRRVHAHAQLTCHGVAGLFHTTGIHHIDQLRAITNEISRLNVSAGAQARAHTHAPHVAHHKLVRPGLFEGHERAGAHLVNPQGRHCRRNRAEGQIAIVFHHKAVCTAFFELHQQARAHVVATQKRTGSGPVQQHRQAAAGGGVVVTHHQGITREVSVDIPHQNDVAVITYRKLARTTLGQRNKTARACVVHHQRRIQPAHVGADGKRAGHGVTVYIHLVRVSRHVGEGRAVTRKSAGGDDTAGADAAVVAHHKLVCRSLLQHHEIA